MAKPRRIALAGFSIGTRLFLAASVCSGIILLLAGLGLATVYQRLTERAFDQRLRIYVNQLAADLAAPVDSERSTIGASFAEPRFDLPLSGWYWQVTQLDNPAREVRLSKSLLGAELPILSDLGVRAGPGESREGYAPGPDEVRLRVVERRIDLGDEGRFLVAVGAPANEIRREIVEFNIAVAITFVVLGVVLVLSTLLQVRFGLKPLSDLGHAVASVRRGEADRITGTYPQDLAPLAGELNLLLDTNRDIVERARTHVGNLAHALKTPLSVIANEARANPGPLADKIVEQTGAMRDQVDYHLARARAAALASKHGAPTPARRAVDGLVRVFAKLHTDRGLTIAVDVGDDILVRCEEQDIQEMLGNLIDNACKWARSEVLVTARSDRDGALPRVTFHVDDDGPGLAADQRASVLARGRRLDETRPGSGLGLSIVVDLVALYGGSLTLSTAPAGGLRASLTLPAI